MIPGGLYIPSTRPPRVDLPAPGWLAFVAGGALEPLRRSDATLDALVQVDLRSGFEPGDIAVWQQKPAHQYQVLLKRVLTQDRWTTFWMTFWTTVGGLGLPQSNLGHADTPLQSNTTYHNMTIHDLSGTAGLPSKRPGVVPKGSVWAAVRTGSPRQVVSGTGDPVQ